MHYVLRPLSNLSGFDPTNFDIAPHRWGFKYSSAISDKLLEDIRNTAERVPSICIAIVTDNEDSTYVVGEKIPLPGDKSYSKLALFNASICKEAEADIHAISKRDGINLVRYDEYLRYEKGAIA